MAKIVGIDLGTSTTCLSVVLKGEPVVIPDSRGNRVTPSYIHVMEDGRVLVGPQAKFEVIADPYSTIWATKRLIGRRFDDPRVQECVEHFSYRIMRADDGGVLLQGREQKLSPVEVGAIMLKYMVRLGSKFLGEPIKTAVITVPAYFNDIQRKATKQCGETIGLDVIRLLNEPTAAALAWGYHQDVQKTIAIFDLGGGTFDVSILTIANGVYEVLATKGDSWLGGEDFDNRLVELIVEDFKQKYKINIYNDKIAHQRVKDAAERAKIELSANESTRVYLPSICPDLSRYADVDATITRDQYQYLVEDLVVRTISIFESTVKDAGLSFDKLDNVVLVGGMTRMPLVRNKVKELIKKAPDISINPDEAVAMGAAIHAASLAGEKIARKVAAPARPQPVMAPQDQTYPVLQPINVGLVAPASAQPRGDVTMPGWKPGTPVSPEVTWPGSSPTGIADQELTKPEYLSEEAEQAPAPDNQDMTRPGKSFGFGEQPLIDIEPAGESKPPLERDAQLPISLEQVAAEAALPIEKERLEAERAGDNLLPISKTETREEPAPELELEPAPAAAPEEESAIPLEPAPEPAPEPEPRREEEFAAEMPSPPQVKPASAADEKIAEPEPEKEMVEAPILLDVLSQTVGIAHLGGLFVPLIERNSKLPARVSQVFTTAMDQQKAIRVIVFQGDDKHFKHNVKLGEFVLSGIEQARRGVPQIEVTFDIDQSGLFMVSAKDMRTKAEKEVKIEGIGGPR